jgi:hypothetical protein
VNDRKLRNRDIILGAILAFVGSFLVSYGVDTRDWLSITVGMIMLIVASIPVSILLWREH